ncbi:uncharacterized protein WM294_007606 [Sarcoramphus papa]
MDNLQATELLLFLLSVVIVKERSGATVLLQHPNINRKVCKTALKTIIAGSVVDKLERTAEALRVYFQGFPNFQRRKADYLRRQSYTEQQTPTSLPLQTGSMQRSAL